MEIKDNILFYSGSFAHSSSGGGTEIATWRVAEYLNSKGRKIFHVFENDNSVITPVYEKIARITGPDFSNQLAEFLRVNNIKVIVNEGMMYNHRHVVEAIRLSGLDVKIIYVSHCADSDEMVKSRFRWLWREFCQGYKRKKNFIRMSAYPLYYLRRHMNIRKWLDYCYETSDCVVMLTKGNLDSYGRLKRRHDISKTVIIPNIIPESLEPSNNSKENRLLVLSRLDEAPKRISLILKAWKLIQKDGRFSEWTLDIVGDGPDRKSYERQCRRLGLKNIVFHGWQDPGTFLDKSRFLLISSRYEGFCMTIVEGQTHGCVPIAFDSFPAASQLINDGYNGIMVERYGDVKAYAIKLMDYMCNTHLWEKVSTSARESARLYHSEDVGPLWINLIDNL